MSIYWIFVNHTKKERIDPVHIGDGPVKEWQIVRSETARLLAHVMFNAWQGDHVTMEPDSDLERLASFETYPEVGEREVNQYNVHYPDTPLRFVTPSSP